MVTGGATDKKYLDSTEILEAGGTWRLTAPLPSARDGLSAAVLDNKILVFGEDILCFIKIENLIMTIYFQGDGTNHLS